MYCRRLCPTEVADRRSAKNDTTKIWVPPQKIPFLGTAPGAEHKETTYVDHESSLLNEQIRGAGMGSLIVIFLSFSSGMHFPILLQAIMGPMNLVDNVFVKRYLLGSQVDRPFGESLHAPGSEPEAVTATPAAADSSVAGAETVRQIHNDIEQLMFDTWDSDGASLTEEAFDELTKAHAANPEGLAQYKTARQGWTLLMVLCGVHREELTAVTKALHWVLNHSANVSPHGAPSTQTTGQTTAQTTAQTNAGRGVDLAYDVIVKTSLITLLVLLLM